MKIELYEWDEMAYMKLKPETLEESTQLMRITNNRSAEKPSITFYFGSKEPVCEILIKKIKPSVQRNSIQRK